MADLSEIYMHTSSGKKYFPFAPKAEHVDVQVIAHHLATRARWNGATQHSKYKSRIFLSVAEHSVLVSLYLEHFMMRPDLALYGLLHDASEAFNGDLIRPLKYSAEFSAPFKKVEIANEEAIARRFNLPVSEAALIKVADEAVCAAEYQQVVPRETSCGDWDDDLQNVKPAPFEIEMLPPFEAMQNFMNHYHRITGCRDLTTLAN